MTPGTLGTADALRRRDRRRRTCRMLGRVRTRAPRRARDVDRRLHPREKPCGGGVTGRALALVVRRDRRAPPAALRHSHGALRRLGRNTSTAVPLGTRALVVASRTEFDGALLDAASSAGATIVRVARARRHARCRAASSFRQPAGQIRARTLIGADGANSLVRRRLATPFARAELSIATGYFVHGVTSQEIVLELVDDPPGYIWSFPRPTHLAVGICAQADAGTSAGDPPRAGRRRGFDDMNLAGEATLEPYSWPIPSLSPRELRAPLALRPRVVSRRRRRGSRRSDHAGRHLLRVAIGRVGGRGRRKQRRIAPGITSRFRMRSRPTWFARRATRQDSSSRGSEVSCSQRCAAAGRSAASWPIWSPATSRMRR